MCLDKKKHLVEALTVSVKWWLLRWRWQPQLPMKRRKMRESGSYRVVPVCFVTVNSTLTLLDLIK